MKSFMLITAKKTLEKNQNWVSCTRIFKIYKIRSLHQVIIYFKKYIKLCIPVKVFSRITGKIITKSIAYNIWAHNIFIRCRRLQYLKIRIVKDNIIRCLYSISIQNKVMLYTTCLNNVCRKFILYIYSSM